MATAFQIGAFQGEGFQIEGGAPAFTLPYYWTMVTSRQATKTGPVSGLTSSFPVALGGTEALRTLRRVTGSQDVAPRVSVGVLSYVGQMPAEMPFDMPGMEGMPEVVRSLRRTANVTASARRIASLTAVESPRIQEG